MLLTFTVNVKIIINTTSIGPHFLFVLELGNKTRFQMNIDFYFEKPTRPNKTENFQSAAELHQDGAQQR